MQTKGKHYQKPEFKKRKLKINSFSFKGPNGVLIAACVSPAFWCGATPIVCCDGICSGGRCIY